MTSSNIHAPEQEFGSIPMDKLMQFSGLELLQQMLAGEVPGPTIARTMNFTISEVSSGGAVFRGEALADHYNPLGTVHGGWAATIIDSALGCAVQTKLPKGVGFTTIEFKVNLVRPIFDHTGEVVCEGNVIHIGRTIATCEANLKTKDGKLLAHGTATCAIFPIKQPGG